MKAGDNVSNLKEHRKYYNLVSFIDVELMFGVVVADTDPQTYYLRANW